MGNGGTCLSVHSKPSWWRLGSCRSFCCSRPARRFSFRRGAFPSFRHALRMLAQPPPSTTDVPERQEADAFWEHPGLVRSACEEILVAVENSYGVVPGCVPVKGTAPTPTPTPPQPWPDD